jgi:hypothetical protein
MTATIDHAFIMESLFQATPMLRNMAYRYGLDFDDCYQDAYLVVHRIVAERGAHEQLRGYIHSHIKFSVLTTARNRYGSPLPLSLDMPMSSDSNVALADRLAEAAPTPVDEDRQLQRARRLYASLRKLPLNQQRELRRAYKLFQFVPHRNARYTFQIRKPGAASLCNLRAKAMMELKRDQALREAVLS